MKVETITVKKLIITKEEQRVIAEIQKLLNEDNSVPYEGVWDILTDIANGSHKMAPFYGYDIKIVS